MTPPRLDGPQTATGAFQGDPWPGAQPTHDHPSLRSLRDAQVAKLKAMERTFYEFCDEVGIHRETAIAKTKMEEATMWVLKAVLRG